MDEKPAPLEGAGWPWTSRRRQNLISSMLCWRVFPSFYLSNPLSPRGNVLPWPLLCSGFLLPACLSCITPFLTGFIALSAHRPYGIPMASLVDLVSIAAKCLHPLTSLLSSDFYFQASARHILLRYLSGISNTTCPKLNLLSSPRRSCSSFVPSSGQSPPFKQSTCLPWTPSHSLPMSSPSPCLDHSTWEISAEPLHFSLSPCANFVP